MRVLLLVALLLLTGSAVRAGAIAPAEARARVEHHLRHVEQLTAHFEALITESCQRFPSHDAWDTYTETDTDQLVLLMAHLDQAGVVAKGTRDDDALPAAKTAPPQSKQVRPT